MRGEKTVCRTMLELLTLMNREYGSKKTGAVLRRLGVTPDVLHVEEFFDDGKGHSGAFTSTVTPIANEVFEEALAERYIHGKLEPGYVSRYEFVITDLGREAHTKSRELVAEVHGMLLPGKGVRICELELQLKDVSQKDIESALEELLRIGHAEIYQLEGQKFYLSTIR